MLIDVHNCKKLTGQKWLDKIDLKQEYCYYDCEQGVWWCICETDKQSRIIAQCKTEEEAKRKLEELKNSILERGEKADD